MKIKKSKTRVLVSLSPKEYELLSEALNYCDDTIQLAAQENNDIWKSLLNFCQKFFDADADPVSNLRGAKR